MIVMANITTRATIPIMTPATGPVTLVLLPFSSEEISLLAIGVNPQQMRG